jgi:hypothetical protein
MVVESRRRGKSFSCSTLPSAFYSSVMPTVDPVHPYVMPRFSHNLRSCRKTRLTSSSCSACISQNVEEMNTRISRAPSAPPENFADIVPSSEILAPKPATFQLQSPIIVRLLQVLFHSAVKRRYSLASDWILVGRFAVFGGQWLTTEGIYLSSRSRRWGGGIALPRSGH